MLVRLVCITALCVCSVACERSGGTSPSEPRLEPGKTPGKTAADGATIETEQVAGGIHMLKGKGGNIGVSVGSDGVLMIDDKFAPLAPKIRAAIAKVGGGKVDFLINTHHHGDHTGGNAIFGKEARIIAHANVRKRLAEKGPPAALPVVTYKDEVVIHFNGDDIRVWHMANGHTDGDSLVLFTKANVLHTGDHFFNGRFPFVDRSSGGDPRATAANVESLLAKLPAGVKIIPGHGPLATRKDLEVYAGMLRQTMAHVKTQVDAGKTLDQIKAAGLPKKWHSWGTGFVSTDRWIETLYATFKS